MQLSLYNTLTQRHEIFKPLDKNLVKMYVCGPTVYDSPHIGNARSVVVYDILQRILVHIFGKEHVLYVRNITDIDDKIIERAKSLNIPINQLTQQTTIAFHRDMAYLGCQSPNIEPKATEHVAEMLAIIEQLIAFKYAYVADKHVYFDVSAAKDYTKLSRRQLDELLQGVRIENDISKRHPQDFVLWKIVDEGSLKDLECVFDSPWGAGRPGWHIECSAMSNKYLGQTFDIHGGGADLIFPHHTNEIAQSTCAFEGSLFAKTWVHNGFLTVNGNKMSKSLGNFVTVKELLEKNIPGETIRLFLLSTHYRKPLDFNDKALHDSSKLLNYWYRALSDANTSPINLPDNFLASLFDDMNTSLAIKIINDYAKQAHAATKEDDKTIYTSLMLACANFIGLLELPADQWFTPDSSEIKQDNDVNIEELIEKRLLAKQEKNWALADKIRGDLLKLGIVLEDKPDGETKWRKAD